MISRIFHLIFLVVLLLQGFTSAQDKSDSTSNAPKIYIECDYCWKSFLQDNLSFLNFVRMREEADIFIQILDNYTASDGKEYILDLIGRNKMSGTHDTVTFHTDVTMSSDDERNKLLKFIKIGLLRFLVNTTLIDKVNINYSSDSLATGVVEHDNWDNWMFSISGQSYFNGQNTNKTLSLWTSLSAKRLTEDFKTNISIGNNYNEDSFDYSDLKLTSASRSFYGNIGGVWSIGNKWAAGAWLQANHSSFSNIDLGVSAGPGIEYNFFPYSEYARREFRINYGINAVYQKYRDTTIYDKLTDFLIVNSFSSTFELIEPWGNFSVTITGDANLDNIRRNRLSMYTYVSIWVFKGFSVNFSLNYSSIHNQLNIAKGSATLDEILLRRRQLESNYSYWGSVGISYSFGSIYNNIINTRFGG